MTRKQRTDEQGNILFLILIAVVLLGALTYVMSGSSGDQSVTSSQAARISEDLKSQAQLIRSALLECNLTQNYGYPAQPVSGLVKDLQCKIDDVPTYRGLFTGTADRMLPIPTVPFDAWQYVNDGAGTIKISVTASGTGGANPGVISALNQLKKAYGTDEVTIVNDGVSASFTLFITKP